MSFEEEDGFAARELVQDDMLPHANKTRDNSPLPHGLETSQEDVIMTIREDAITVTSSRTASPRALETIHEETAAVSSSRPTTPRETPADPLSPTLERQDELLLHAQDDVLPRALETVREDVVMVASCRSTTPRETQDGLLALELTRESIAVPNSSDPTTPRTTSPAAFVDLTTHDGEDHLDVIPDRTSLSMEPELTTVQTDPTTVEPATPTAAPVGWGKGKGKRAQSPTAGEDEDDEEEGGNAAEPPR
ncbi:hypothetical protein GGF32_002824 [Allomyces javanicus]|nr:hypothetical protein GGF32_002824 [Allomyces javanicus]